VRDGGRGEQPRQLIVVAFDAKGVIAPDPQYVDSDFLWGLRSQLSDEVVLKRG
jgi:hypothetical protein